MSSRVVGIYASIKIHAMHSNYINCYLFADITKFDQLPQLFDKVANLVKDDGLNVIINNAGICSSSDKLEQIEMADFDEHMLVNVKVPLMMTKTMLPLLKRAAEDTYGWIVNMTSVLGSIAANSSGGYYTYRASKAALNAVTKNLSVELKHDRILSVMLHPGWVQTDMGGAGADITIEQSCSGLINIITHLQPNQNGKFYQYNGQELPW